VYVPLGGNRVSRSRWRINILITFVVSGLWHGANWTYVIWGGLNGFYQVASASTKGLRASLGGPALERALPHLHRLFASAMTFVLICVAWVFFRAPTIGDAFAAFGQLVRNHGPLFTADAKELIYGAAGIAVVLAVDYRTRGRPFERALSDMSTPYRWSLYLLLILGILAAGVFNASQFIYFQF